MEHIRVYQIKNIATDEVNEFLKKSTVNVLKQRKKCVSQMYLRVTNDYNQLYC